MPKRKLETISNFIEEQVLEFSKEEKCFTETAFHIFTHKGIEVQLVLQRESFHKIKGTSLFDKGELK